MSARMLAVCLALAIIAGCRDEGLVGEGSECAEACPIDQRCVDGACVPANVGAAGDDSELSDEDDYDHDGDGHGGGPGDDRPDNDRPGDPGF